LFEKFTTLLLSGFHAREPSPVQFFAQEQDGERLEYFKKTRTRRIPTSCEVNVGIHPPLRFLFFGLTPVHQLRILFEAYVSENIGDG